MILVTSMHGTRLRATLMFVALFALAFMLGCSATDDGQNSSSLVSDKQRSSRPVVGYRIVKVNGHAEDSLIELSGTEISDEDPYPIARVGLYVPVGSSIQTGTDTDVILVEILESGEQGSYLSLRGGSDLVLNPDEQEVVKRTGPARSSSRNSRPGITAIVD